MQDKSAEREIDVCIFIYAPVALCKVAVHSLVDVEHKPFCIADCFVSGAVQNVRFGNFNFLVFDEYAFYNILNFLNCRNGVCAFSCHLDAQDFLDFVGECRRSVRVRVHFDGGDCLSDGALDFPAVIRCYFAGALDD